MASEVPRLLVAGETFEDLIFAGLPRLPFPGEEVRTNLFRRTFGGGALIAAAWARTEGLDVDVLSALPPRVGQILTREGIGWRDLRRTREPHAVTASLSCGAERSFATFTGVNAVLEERLYLTLRRHNSTAPFSGVLLDMPPYVCTAWAEAMRRMKNRTEVFWDFGYDEELPAREGFGDILANAAGIFVNAQEAALYNGPDELLDRAAKGGTVVVVKRGRDGAELYGKPKTRVPAPIPLHGVRDTTGAGDAFAAGFLARRLRGGSVEEQLAAGNVCGARSVQHLGGLPARPWAPRA